MNDDPIPSAAAASGSEPANNDRPEGNAENAPEGGRAGGARKRSRSVARRAKAGLAKKLEFTTHLMTSLDMVVFAELCALYYLDCSLFRLIIRMGAHSMFLSPKSEEYLALVPAHRPHVFAVFGPNAICMLLHIFSTLPTASEAMRGYLHGGVIIDFVGQKAPTSKLGLLLLDLVILAIQCFMLAVHAERQRLRKIVLPSRATQGGSTESGATPATDTTTAPPAPSQDHDAEERGVLRNEATTLDETNDIEMRPLSGQGAHGAGEDEGESSRLIAESSRRRLPELMDTLRSGNAILNDFHVIQAIRTAGNDYQGAAAYSLQTLGYTASLARLAAERRARVEIRRRRQQQQT